MSAWVKCSDRMPETGDAVLVYGVEPGRASMTVARWAKHYSRTMGAWQLEQTGTYAEDSDVWPTPTHWMPLPEAPQG
jgi:Protein of unknown function (DUF551)